MATVTPNFNWPVPTSTDLVKDGATAIEALGDSIDGSLVDLKGGTTGQVLSKTSGTDMDFTWVTTDDANAIQNSIVDAKGDLISATANDTPARLAVGANGETLVADSSTSTGLRYQVPKTNNVIINGNMDIWQRGTSFSPNGSGSFSADRFEATLAGTGTYLTASQQTTVPNSNSKYSLRYLQSSGNATSVTEYCTRQRIEQSNIIPLLGKATVLSFWYRSNKTGSHGVRIYGSYNTGGTDQVTTITVNAADTWEYKTVAVTAFSAVSASSANPTDAGALLDVGFRVGGAGAGFTTVSLNDYFQITQMQLEVGSVATPFARAGGTIQGELAACQRYYYRITAAQCTIASSGYTYATTNGLGFMYLPVSMRVVPTAIDYLNVAAVDFNNATLTTSSIGIGGGCTPAIITIDVVVTGATANRSMYIRGTNSNSYFGLSAEL
jgi:hypothetical protein